jgi:hypothetical protein
MKIFKEITVFFMVKIKRLTKLFLIKKSLVKLQIYFLKNKQKMFLKKYNNRQIEIITQQIYKIQLLLIFHFKTFVSLIIFNYFYHSLYNSIFKNNFSNFSSIIILFK